MVVDRARTRIHWELPLIHYLERTGATPRTSPTPTPTPTREPSSHHRLVITAGHGEYWTKGMFDAFDAARDAGTNLAFMGANTDYWQIRYDLDRRRIVSFKNWDNDPIADTSLKTVRFSDLRPPRYECELMGVQHLGGSYTHAVDDYTVSDAAPKDPWFRGTGFHAGDTVRQVVSGERDDIPPGQAPGQACGHPMTILFSHPQTPQLQAAVALRYLAASGARVFSTGSHDFAMGLEPWRAARGSAARALHARTPSTTSSGPLEPLSLTAQALGGAVALTAVAPADARIRPDDRPDRPRQDVTLVHCRPGRGVDHPPRGRWRYAATTVDRWGSSARLVSKPVRVH